ncbi:hypothetical protein V8F20_003322 [Naviculisporaceae sp. PSN 640]
MKSTIFRLGMFPIALLLVPSVMAEPTMTASTTTTTTSKEPSCTASLITTLCDYPEPFPGTAVASSGKQHCWGYCNVNPPCDFVIFAAGNPHTGTGTCWVYPGETFDQAKGTADGCSNPYLSVYSKPECEYNTPPSATVPGGGCAATASPSAVASACGYPPPDDDCFYSCRASTGAVHCLSLCAESDACAYAVFNPQGRNSPYTSGNCWIFADGEYDAAKAGTCGGEGPEQFVYKNVCPKPKLPSAVSSSSSPSATSGTDGGSATESDSLNPSATGQGDKAEAKDGGDRASSAPVAFSLSSLLAAVVLVVWL